MSSIISDVSYLQQLELCQVASAAALLYDYLLAFGSEVDLIWARKWNLVTLLYAIVRYLSFFLILVNLFYMGNMSWSPNVSLVWYQLVMWGPYIFRGAMDIIMMKRIYALSCSPSRFLNSSKWVLCVMVTAFIAKYALCITFFLLAIGPGSQLTSIEADFAGTRVCGTFMSKSNFLISAEFPVLGFEILLFVLAFGYFVADVWESWGSQGSKMGKVNDLVRILVRDSTIYFAINVVASALDIANSKITEPVVFIGISLALQNFLPFCFAPRLVINVKEHENRVHMSEVGGELVDIHFELDMPQGMQQTPDFA